MLLNDLAATVTAVGATRSRRRKVELLADCVKAMAVDEIAVGVSYLSGTVRQEPLGIGPAGVRAAAAAPAPAPELELADVDRALEALAAIAGPGSTAARQAALTALFAAATEAEQRFLRDLLLGDLRQGALAGIVTQAVARACDVEEPLVRRAIMLRGDLGDIALTAVTGGAAALGQLRLELFRPLQPMLAQTSPSVEAAFEHLTAAAVEYKLDGARVQVHRDGDTIRVYTRNLRDVTARTADVAAVVRRFNCRRVVLDGEVLTLDHTGRPEPFQRTMARFGTDADADTFEADAGLIPFFFDILHLDGADLIDEPLSARAESMTRVVPQAYRVERVVADSARAGEVLLANALADGHEGVLIKALASPYEAGRRGASWRKVKPVHTLDLVVLAAEWGSGRRRGWLSNLHLGARDPDCGGFVMLGKTFKGLTDELLAWQTTRLLELAERRDRHVVFVRPELVVEIAVDGIQTSPRYPGGMALRFARVRGYREDKSPAEADTIDTVRALYEGRRPAG